MIRTLVVLLLAFFLSSVQGQNLGLTESGHDEDKTTCEILDSPQLHQTNGYTLLYLNPFQKLNSLDRLTKSLPF